MALSYWHLGTYSPLQHTHRLSPRCLQFSHLPYKVGTRISTYQVGKTEVQRG